MKFGKQNDEDLNHRKKVFLLEAELFDHKMVTFEQTDLDEHDIDRDVLFKNIEKWLSSRNFELDDKNPRFVMGGKCEYDEYEAVFDPVDESQRFERGFMRVFFHKENEIVFIDSMDVVNSYCDDIDKVPM